MRYPNLVLFSLLAAIWGSAFVAMKAGLGDSANQAYLFDAPVFFAAMRFSRRPSDGRIRRVDDGSLTKVSTCRPSVAF